MCPGGSRVTFLCFHGRETAPSRTFHPCPLKSHTTGPHQHKPKGKGKWPLLFCKKEKSLTVGDRDNQRKMVNVLFALVVISHVWNIRIQAVSFIITLLWGWLLSHINHLMKRTPQYRHFIYIKLMTKQAAKPDRDFFCYSLLKIILLSIKLGYL